MRVKGAWAGSDTGLAVSALTGNDAAADADVAGPDAAIVAGAETESCATGDGAAEQPAPASSIADVRMKAETEAGMRRAERGGSSRRAGH
jgi:hypothetical protein